MFLQNSNGYGFLPEEKLPAGSYRQKTLPGVEHVAWLTTGEVSDIGHNHCAAVLATNLSLYADFLKGTESVEGRDLFRKFHARIGNGPILRVAKKAKQTMNMHVTYDRIYSFEEITWAIDRGDPVALLLAGALFDWHWVLVIGYRIYDSGRNFLQLVNGWDKSSAQYYEWQKGSFAASATRYRFRKNRRNYADKGAE